MVTIVKRQLQKVDPSTGNWWAVVAMAFFLGCILGWVGAVTEITAVTCDNPRRIMILVPKGSGEPPQIEAQLRPSEQL